MAALKILINIKQKYLRFRKVSIEIDKYAKGKSELNTLISRSIMTGLLWNNPSVYCKYVLLSLLNKELTV